MTIFLTVFDNISVAMATRVLHEFNSLNKLSTASSKEHACKVYQIWPSGIGGEVVSMKKLTQAGKHARTTDNTETQKLTLSLRHSQVSLNVDGRRRTKTSHNAPFRKISNSAQSGRFALIL